MSEDRTDEDATLPEGVREMYSTHIITLVIVAVIGLGTVVDRFHEDRGVVRP